MLCFPHSQQEKTLWLPFRVPLSPSVVIYILKNTVLRYQLLILYVAFCSLLDIWDASTLCCVLFEAPLVGYLVQAKQRV
jgi:hypothetical protein